LTEQPHPDALVIGESLVDIVETADGEIVETPGGSALNVAITLARLGVETLLLTAIGDDERADQIEGHLAASGIALVEGTRRLRRTSTAAARLQADGSARYAFDVAWEPPDVAPPPARVVHAGSLALFLEPGATLVRRRLETATATALVTLDPNVRPTLLPARDTVLPGFEELLPLAHVVKLSDEDAAWLYPGVPERDVVRRLLDLGPSLITITRGSSGCVLACRDSVVELPAAPTDVVDTIGAGDSFMGALIQQLLLHDLIQDLRAGRALWPEELAVIGGAAARVAAVTVGRRGADPPRLAELHGVDLADQLPTT
jgi:fructokinase